jgi:hypothetical protein
MGVEDELGAIVADLGFYEDAPGGPYANVRSAIGKHLENNKAVATFVGKIADQFKVTGGNLVLVVTTKKKVSA